MPRSAGLQLPLGALSSDTALRAEDDYFAWTRAQAEAVREGRLDAIDREGLAEEIDDLGRSAKREIASRLHVLIVHLLKWMYQPSGRSGSWKGTIVEQRNAIVDLIAESPSLRAYPGAVLDRQHQSARLKASGETGLAEKIFPDECPFPIEDILRSGFFPQAEG